MVTGKEEKMRLENVLWGQQPVPLMGAHGNMGRHARKPPPFCWRTHTHNSRT